MARAKVPKGFERIHPLLRSAMDVAYRDDWPASPHRGDGPRPQLSGRDQVDIALWFADSIAPRVTAAQKKLFMRALRWARRYPREGLHFELTEAEIATLKEESPAPEVPLALELVRCATAPAGFLPIGASAIIRGMFAYASIARGSAALFCGAATGRAEPRVKAFLDELDSEILRRELLSLLAKREISPSAPVARVLFRPAGSGRLPALVLARLENQRYGLWVKLKARWDWIEGDRDHVLASIPDAHFDGAMNATLGQSE
jgi:hypothetical protein